MQYKCNINCHCFGNKKKKELHMFSTDINTLALTMIYRGNMEILERD